VCVCVRARVQSPFTFTTYFYSLCNQAIIVSVYILIFDWKTGIRDI